MTDSVRNRSLLTTFIMYGILAIGTLLVLIPFWWMIITSFETLRTTAMPNPPRFYPHEFTFDNYRMVLDRVDIARYTLNNFILMTLSFLFNAITASLAGFALSKGRFPLRNVLLIFFLSSLMVPFESRIIEIHRIINMIGLNDSFAGYLMPGIMTNAFYIFLMKKAFDDMPDSLMESANMDGAPLRTIWFRIYLPLILPVVAAMGVLDAVNVWNDLLWPLIIFRSRELFTVQLALMRFLNPHAGILSAFVMLSIVPISVVFLIFQKWIIQGIATSGIKG